MGNRSTKALVDESPDEVRSKTDECFSSRPDAKIGPRIFSLPLSKQRAVRRRALTGGLVGLVVSEMIYEPIHHG
jgi:hypothetical protein